MTFNFTETKRVATLLWNTLLYRIKPTRCHVCNSKLNFDGSVFVSSLFGRRFAITRPDGKPICEQCLLEKLNQYYAGAYLTKQKPCDACGSSHPVTNGVVDGLDVQLNDHEIYANKRLAKSLELNVRYGFSWQYGADLCKSCVTTILSKQSSRSMYWTEIFGKHYFVNHKRALIRKEDNE